MSQTSMLHVRINDDLKTAAAEKLAGLGLSISDAVRILLTRIAKDEGLPAGLTMGADGYDAWFRAMVQEALDDKRPVIAHGELMDDVQDLIDRKRRAACA